MSTNTPDKKRPKVLIVDDSPAMRQLLSISARRFNAEVVEAGNGLDALKHLATGGFDLLFLDLNMPILDGKKVIVRVREDPQLAHVPICVVTTTDDDEIEQQLRSIGATYFLRKPTNRRAVDEVLVAVLQRA